MLLIIMTLFILDAIRKGVVLIHSLVAFYYLGFRHDGCRLKVKFA